MAGGPSPHAVLDDGFQPPEERLAHAGRLLAWLTRARRGVEDATRPQPAKVGARTAKPETEPKGSPKSAGTLPPVKGWVKRNRSTGGCLDGPAGQIGPSTISQVAARGWLAFRPAAPVVQEGGRVKDYYSVAGWGGVVARITGNEGVGARGNGHLEKRRVVWIGQVGL